MPKGRRSKKLRKGETFGSIIISSFTNNNSDNQLTEEWKDWIETLKDYSLSINNKQGSFPRRVFITNGEWMILFLDPKDSFSSTFPNPNNILVYQKWSEIEEKSNEIFRYLEYYNVLGNTPYLTLGEINFYLNKKQIDKVMFGLKLMYTEDPQFYLDPSPCIKVVPILFIRSTSGVWFQVDAENPKFSKQIPTNPKYLSEHLQTFRENALELLSKVNMKLGINLTCSSLVEHYADQKLFEEFNPISKIKSPNNLHGEDFLIATGENTHYLLDESTMPNCPYHNWDNCDIEGDAVENPIKRVQTSEPRTIFVDSTEYHCSHKEIHTAKSSKITIENRHRCGPRSGKEQEAFCEIWAFEQHLCCRTCAFERVCTKADVFSCLPCKSI